MVELLDSGRVLGLYQGRSESGPRALGNRTILGDPRHPKMQDFINKRVKGREWFRPLAPIVLEKSAGKYFDIEGAAPFMQFASDVRPEYREQLPAITHVDGTARLQTVEAKNTPFLFDLLTGLRGKDRLSHPAQHLAQRPRPAPRRVPAGRHRMPANDRHARHGHSSLPHPQTQRTRFAGEVIK